MTKKLSSTYKTNHSEYISAGVPKHLKDVCRITTLSAMLLSFYIDPSVTIIIMTNGPINAHLTIAQVMPKYNHNNVKQEALL